MLESLYLITCHCLWKYGISELSIVHENAICLYQGRLLLTNIDEPFQTNFAGTCFQRKPCIKKNTRKGPSQALSVLLRDVWQAHDFSQHC